MRVLSLPHSLPQAAEHLPQVLPDVAVNSALGSLPSDIRERTNGLP